MAFGYAPLATVPKRLWSSRHFTEEKRPKGTLRLSLANLPPCLIGIEGSASAQRRARELSGRRHEVKLMSPQFVKPERSRNVRLVDLAKDRFDAGIRLGEFIASDMVAVRLTPSFRLIVVGSPDYLARAGRPRTPSDLASQACVRLRRSGGTLASWRLQDDGSPVELVVSGPLVVHDYPSMLDAALAGVALAQVPEPIAHEHALAGRLREGLAKCAATTLGVFLYCSDRKQVSSKLRAFIDMRAISRHPEETARRRTDCTSAANSCGDRVRARTSLSALARNFLQSRRQGLLPWQASPNIRTSYEVPKDRPLVGS